MGRLCESRVVRILAIDGGGVRGLIPAMVLAEIERLSGQPVCRLFDLIAGTSTGGILALALAAPGPGGGPRYSAADMVAFYERQSSLIFRRPLRRRILSLGGLLEEKYPSSGLERALEQCFGSATLRESLCDVIVNSYETERRFPFFFKSRNARAKEGYDFPMKAVARATAAAPACFEPLRLEADGVHEYYSLIDGGVYANNPALCGYVEARTTFPHCEEVILVSLGTGELVRPLPFREARRWGLVGWGRRILDVMFQGASITADYQLRQLLPPRQDGFPRYWRFQPKLHPENEALDDSSPENLRFLKLLAESMIRDCSAGLGRLCARLIE